MKELELDDVESWLEASDKNGVIYSIFDFLIFFLLFCALDIQQSAPQDGALSFEEFKFAFVGTNMIDL